MYRPFIAPSILIAFAILPRILVATPAIEIDDVYDLRIITEDIEHFKDTDGKLTWQQLKDREFQPLTQSIFNAPASTASHWFRFKIINSTDQILYLRVGDAFNTWSLDAYGPIRMGKSLKVIRSGALQHPSKHVINEFAYFIPVTPTTSGEPDTYYFNIKGHFPISQVFQLGLEKDQLAFERSRDRTIAFFQGVMMAVILYNLFLLISIREKVFLYYISYLALMLVITPFTYGRPMIQVHWFWEYYFVIQVPLVILITLFAVRYLSLDKISRPLSLWLWSLCSTIAFSGILNLLLPQMLPDIIRWTQPILMLHNLSLTLSGIYAWKKGYKKARFYVLAWVFVLSGVMIFILTLNGVLPYNIVTSNALIFGVCLESIFFAMALGDRLNILKKEHEHMHREKVELMANQNVDLEWKVSRKTQELQASYNLTSELNQKLINTNRKLTRQREDLQNALDNVKRVQNQLILSEKMAALGVLSAGIGHEINNPLNYIQGGVLAIKDEFEKETPDREKLKSYLSSIMEGVQRCARITRSLTNYSRQDFSMTEPCHVKNIIESCLQIIRNQLRDIQVIKHFPKESIIVQGNGGSLHQALLNILINAAQSIEKQGVITITLDALSDHISLSIRDTGTGIHEDHLSKIGDPFFTTKPVGEGTGLGLWITYSIIKDHGGNIECSSKEGRGTEFIIHLPATIPFFAES